jgi:hypothetical protein
MEPGDEFSKPLSELLKHRWFPKREENEMKSNHHFSVYAIAVAIYVANWILLVRVTRLIEACKFYHRVKASKFCHRLRSLWQFRVNRPVCNIHDPWTIHEVKEGFCLRCLDDHLEGSWVEFGDFDEDEEADRGAAGRSSDVSATKAHFCSSIAARFQSWLPTEIVYSGILQSGRTSA